MSKYFTIVYIIHYMASTMRYDLAYTASTLAKLNKNTTDTHQRIALKAMIYYAIKPDVAIKYQHHNKDQFEKKNILLLNQSKENNLSNSPEPD
ncbi:hypothetical protein FOA43_002378 [Brettanomyces nanus]|uniref:Uncharacterized protein n=1 Tax=Eeniella nana TaxID=13502 RepID=A0A875S259_EENNA|nr:uncharacterized protein FOA43_002378 [Brettanomyces nanus]QPG75038.1 hypothetical protein FOA43_002378 [Brettanomyces nanus]